MSEVSDGPTRTVLSDIRICTTIVGKRCSLPCRGEKPESANQLSQSTVVVLAPPVVVSKTLTSMKLATGAVTMASHSLMI